MRIAFADTGYWVALLVPRDDLHAAAVRAAGSLDASTIVTTEMVLTELLNSLASRGPSTRERSAAFVHDLADSSTDRIVPQTPGLFADALELYERRPDKSWSLTDCASIVICEREGILDVLTYDRHFEQAGFRCLLRDHDAE